MTTRKLLQLLTACTAGLFAPATAAGQVVNVSVTNPSNQQRQELVEVEATTLRQQLTGKSDASENMHFVVTNALGQAVTSQLTRDGKLLFEAAVRPQSSSTYSVTMVGNAQYAAIVSNQRPAVFGALFPNRADDLTWENDRSAYRAYGPALQKSGERAFGYDVWSKSVPELVVEERYRDHMYGENLRWAWRKAGQNAVSDSIVRATSFHYDHGRGLDAYGVGPSLGCGAPALVVGDSLVMSYCWQQYEILENGPLRFSVHLTFDQVNVGGQTLTEHRLITLDKGQHFNRCLLWYEGQQQPLQVAAGVVVHRADTVSLELLPQSILYADPTDRPSLLGSQVYVGVLFPEADNAETTAVKNAKKKGRKPQPTPHAVQPRLVPASLTAAPRVIAGKTINVPTEVVGNAVGITTVQPGQRYAYCFGSSWSGGDTSTFGQWQQRANATLDAIRQPLQVSLATGK
jgi:hypothetical protein